MFSIMIQLYNEIILTFAAVFLFFISSFFVACKELVRVTQLSLDLASKESFNLCNKQKQGFLYTHQIHMHVRT